MRTKVVGIAAAIFVAFFLAGGGLFAQYGASPGTNTQGTTTPESQTEPHRAMNGARHTGEMHGMHHRMSDQSFAKHAATGNMAEVKLGKLAESKGESQTVKDFGKRMVKDHSKADDDLKNAASQANINLPDQPTAKQESAYDRLSKLSGTEFDRAYAHLMLRDHRHDVAQYRMEAKDGKNDAIKDYASQTLPTLEDHLKLAREMNHEVNGSAHHAKGTNMGGY